MDHLFGLATGSTFTRRRGSRSSRLISLIDFLFILLGRFGIEMPLISDQAAAGSIVKGE